MRQSRTVKTFNVADAAYIAGLLDGEGTISLTRRHRNENRQLEVSVSNTDMALLRYLLDCVGAGRITRKRVYNEQHTPSGTYTISNRQALTLLEQVSPYLKTYKAIRARLILDNYIRLTPRNGFYTHEAKELRREFIRAFLNVTPVNSHSSR